MDIVSDIIKRINMVWSESPQLYILLPLEGGLLSEDRKNSGGGVGNAIPNSGIKYFRF